jgi:uncharacterized protein (TIGR02611 family)
VAKLGTAFLGAAVILIGIVLLPLPGPGLLIIVGGIAILARHFVWAKRLEVKCRSYIAKKRGKPEPDSCSVPPRYK